jgi:uncharacterized membrane protein YbhN (UPF0104 family)
MLKAGWRYLRPWLPFALVAGLLYFLIKAVDPARVVDATRHFNWFFLAPLALAFGLYVALRAMRWHLLIKKVDAPNSALDSLLLFAAAQAAVLMPAGQFLLPVLQKSQHGTLIRRSAATVLVQELLFGLLVLPAALPGVPGYQLGGWLLLAAFVVSIMAGAVMMHDPTAAFGLRLMARVPVLRRHVSGFRELRETAVQVASTPDAIVGSALDMAAIAAAGTGLYVVLVGLGAVGPGWTGAVGTYALGNAIATLSSLPGGLGANEDVSTVVLTHMGLQPGAGAAAVLVFRAVTLLLGTALGWTALLLCRRRFGISPTLGGLVGAAQRSEEEASSGREPRQPAKDPAVKTLKKGGT